MMARRLASGRRRRGDLARGISLLAMALAAPAPALAGSALPVVGSAGFVAQIQAHSASPGAVAAAGTNASLPLSTLAQQIAQRSTDNLQRAVAALNNAQRAQSCINGTLTAGCGSLVAAGSQGAPPDGLTQGGLNPALGLLSPQDWATATVASPGLWQNADQPVATTSGGTTTVTVTQTAQRAILSWQSFNVGANTVVHFDQTAGTDSSGNNSWVALNRITGNQTSPAQIFGTIKAEGGVWIIDQNGVLFGPHSRTDLHQLIASALDVGTFSQDTAQRNAQFLSLGLNIPSSGNLADVNAANASFSTTYSPTGTVFEGPVTVDAGAEIATTVQSSDNPGSVMLLGPVVINHGAITASAGQVILAGTRGIGFIENDTVNQATGAEYLGLVPQISAAALLRSGGTASPLFYWPDLATATKAPSEDYVINTGVISTPRGNITLAGTDVENDGVLAATTSISRNGSIVIESVLTTTIGALAPEAGGGMAGSAAGAVVEITPDNNGETIPQGQIISASCLSGAACTVNQEGQVYAATDSPSAVFARPYIDIESDEVTTFNSTLGVINGTATSGIGAVTLASGSAVIAPGGDINLFAGQQVYVSGTSSTDPTRQTVVSAAGLTDADLPASANEITFNPRGPEFANSPLQRAGVLRGQSLTVDIRYSGTTADGISWIGTPLAAVSGYVSAEVTENVEQLLSSGGTVTVATTKGPSDNRSNVVLESGTVLDASGGFVTYDPGELNVSRLITTDGRVLALQQADPNYTYAGIAGTYSVDHSRWGVTSTYQDAVTGALAGVFQPGYIEGHDAGSIDLQSDVVLTGGSLYAQAVAGPYQNATGKVGTATSNNSVDTRAHQATFTQLPVGGAILVNPGATASGGGPFAVSAPIVDALLGGITGSTPYVYIQADRVTVPPAGTAFASQLNAADVNLSAAPLSLLDPTDLADTLVISSALIDAGGFAEFAAKGTTMVAADVTGANALSVTPGGSITLSGAEVDVAGALAAPSGKISISVTGLLTTETTTNGITTQVPAPANAPALTLEPSAILSTRGRWTNDSGLDLSDQTGPAFIDGGSVTLKTVSETVQDPTNQLVTLDVTAGIVVSPGALIDVSGGGYVSPAGVLKATNGVPAGHGGSVTLAVYDTDFTLTNLPTSPVLDASISIDLPNAIKATGFGSDGTLTLRTGASILISGAATTASTAGDGTITLPASYFSAQNPWGAIDLESAIGEVAVEDGAQILLEQANFQVEPDLASLPSGTDLYQAAAIGYTPALQRQVVNLTLGNQGGLALDFTSRAGATANPAPVNAGTVYISADSAILAPAGLAGSSVGGSAITLKSSLVTELEGRIVAPGGTVTLESDGTANASAETFLDATTPVDNGLVFVGPHAVINVSGRRPLVTSSGPYIPDTTNLLYDTGAVVQGGSIYLIAQGRINKSNQFGAVIAEAGSRLVTDGSSATLQYKSVGLGGAVTYTSEQVASDAGQIVLEATSGVFDATVSEQGGSTHAADGLFIVEGSTSSTDTTVVVKQPLWTVTAKMERFVLPSRVIGSVDPATADSTTSTTTTGITEAASFDTANDPIVAAVARPKPKPLPRPKPRPRPRPKPRPKPKPEPTLQPRRIELSASLLNNASLADIVIGSLGTGVESASSGNGITAIKLLGKVRLRTSRLIELGAPIQIIGGKAALAQLATDTLVLGTTPLNASAGITGTQLGTFDAQANGIILDAGLIDAASVNLSSTSDIQVTSPVNTGYANYRAGGLIATGNLTLTSTAITVSGGAEGVLQAEGIAKPDVTLTIQSNGSAPTELGAAGVLYLLGADIVQDGNVLVPGGQIILADEPANPASFRFLGASASTPSLTAAQSITFGSGSVTSVSLDGMSLPYGTTVDGKAWYYGDNVTGSTSGTSPVALTGLPEKLVGVTAGSIDVAQGATIDLSGGGDLVGTEFVPGNGGSRDILSSLNAYSSTSFSGTAFGNFGLDNQVSQVYAILPGVSLGTAPADLDIETNSSLGNQTVVAGMQVSLSGIDGLAAGTYTLLPAAYATLPGAYRVVLVPNSANFSTSQNKVAPDGSYDVSGQLTFAPAPTLPPVANASPGGKPRKSTPQTQEQSATTLEFVVQSSSVWRKYSEIDATSATGLFTPANNLTSRLPIDAGHLILTAGTSLTLDGTLSGKAASGGAGSLVDLALSDPEIVDPGATADPGYVAVDADQLTNFGASSLLIGGTRTVLGEVTTLTPTSTSIEVANDATHPLAAPELILAIAADPAGADPNSAAGIVVASGAVIKTTGNATGGTAQTIVVGATGTNPVAGDGAVLAITTGGTISVERLDLPSNPLGQITIKAGAGITSGHGLTIDSAADANIDPASSVSGTAIVLAGAGISIGDPTLFPATGGGLTLPSSLLPQLAAAQSLTLRSYGGISLYGDIDVSLSGASPSLTFDASTIDSHGGSALFSTGTAGTVTIENTLNLAGDASVAAAAPAGTMTISTGTLILGLPPATATSTTAATTAVSQTNAPITAYNLGSVTVDAAAGVEAEGSGAFDFGKADLAIVTPQLVAGAGAKLVITTTGVADLTAPAGSVAPATGSSLGGEVDLTAAAISVSTVILAPSGVIALKSTNGGIALADGADLSVVGYQQNFFDQSRFADGGSITLTSTAGNISASAGSMVDVAAAAAGGDAGTLAVSAPGGTVSLNGSLQGAAPQGLGAGIAIVEEGALALDPFAAKLTAAGFAGAISITTGTGDLDLNGDLKAASVALTANGGGITIGGTIDVSTTASATGGTISLWARDKVDLERSLLATSPTDGAYLGGAVTIGVSGTPDLQNGQPATDPIWGFEQMTVPTGGGIILGAASRIDTDGGTRDGQHGGTIALVVPVLGDQGSAETSRTLPSLPLEVEPGATLITSTIASAVGAVVRLVSVEGEATWRTSVQSANPNLAFDGIVDPAGFFTATGAAVADPLNSPNMAHATFYQQTLMGWVQLAGDFGTAAAPVISDRAGILAAQGAVFTPGVALVNDRTAINSGSITVGGSVSPDGVSSVADTWNLGAGGYNSDGSISLFYRTKSNEPGQLTLAAVNAVNINSSITDGFFNVSDPESLLSVPEATAQPNVTALYSGLVAKYLTFGSRQLPAGDTTLGYADTPLYAPVAPYVTTDATYVTDYSEYASTYNNAARTSVSYLKSWNSYQTAFDTFAPASTVATDSSKRFVTQVSNAFLGLGQPFNSPIVPSLTAFRTYQDYINAYMTYLTQYNTALANFTPNRVLNADGSYTYHDFVAPSPLQVPPDYGASFLTPTGSFNLTRSLAGEYGANGPAASLAVFDGDPVQSSDLYGTSGTPAANTGSWSYQIVSGVDPASARPDGLVPASTFTATDAASGSIVLNGFTPFVSALSQKVEGLAPTVVRTGTGSIELSAANDVVLAAKNAGLAADGIVSNNPVTAAVYTAGRASAALPAAFDSSSSTDQGSALNGANSLAFSIVTLGSIPAGDDLGVTTALDHDGFLVPNFGSSVVLSAPTIIDVTQAAYGEAGGNVVVRAQNDILAPPPQALGTRLTNPYSSDSNPGDYINQFWTQWLLTRATTLPTSGSGNIANFSATEGVFNPNVAAPGAAAGSDFTAPQDTWWVNYDSFDQGIAALGGGDVTLTAGGNIRNISATTASSGRVTGGLGGPQIFDTSGATAAGATVLHLAATYGLGVGDTVAGSGIATGAVITGIDRTANTITLNDAVAGIADGSALTVTPAVPALVVNGGGDLTVTAGGSIQGGSYYVARGRGRITARETIGADPAFSFGYSDAGGAVVANQDIFLGVGDASIQVAARGTVDIGAVVNPTEIKSALSLTVGDDNIAQNDGVSQLILSGASGAWNFASGTFNTLSQTSAVSIQSVGGDVAFETLDRQNNPFFSESYRLLPATVDVAALQGNVTIDSAFDQANSDSGTLDLLAEQNLRLEGPASSFGTGSGTFVAATGTIEAPIATFQTKIVQTTTSPVPLPGLIDTGFDPNNPADGYDAANATNMLLHADGSSEAHLYAVTGAIEDGPLVETTSNPATTLPIPILTDFAVEIRAGGDITNLQLYAQNAQASDVSVVAAGRDLAYTLPATNAALEGLSNGLNVIELAGPGSLLVTAGRNLGPFPSDFNVGPSGIFTTGNVDWQTGDINPVLPTAGASIIAAAGVGGGIDYQAVIDRYLNPATAAVDTTLTDSTGKPIGETFAEEYLARLEAYLDEIGRPATGAAAWTMFQSLPALQQDNFVYQVFFAELKASQSVDNAEIRDLFIDPKTAVTDPATGLSYAQSPFIQADLAAFFAQPAVQSYLAALPSAPTTDIGRLTVLTSASDATVRAQFLTLTTQLYQTIYKQYVGQAQDRPYLANDTRGYQAINALFPGSLGYTVNNVSGAGPLGALTTAHTGNIDLRSATIQTKQGGDISVLIPGGSILLGSNASRSIYNSPGETGILTFQSGSVNVFADQNITVNQSRILTEEGGDVLTWSSNANILAGIGAKTSADYPPYTVLYDVDAVEALNPAGLVTGAGIGALLTLPNQDATDSNIYLIAPVGTVDAGDAGIRVAGNLVVAAAHVANASNITVGGAAVGVPTAAPVNAGALSSASAAAAAAGKASDDTGNGNGGVDRSPPSIITIDVIGFGGS